MRVGVIGSPDITYRWLIFNDKRSGNMVEFRNNNEIPRLGATAGLSFVYNFGRLGIETGAQFSGKGEKTRPQQLRTLTGTPSDTSVQFVYRYFYIDIQLKLIYNFKISNLYFFVAAGPSVNFNTNNQIVTRLKYSNGSSSTTSSYKAPLYPVNIGFTESFGVEFPFAKDKARLRLEPILRHSVLPASKSSIQPFFYSAGINTGIYLAL